MTAHVEPTREQLLEWLDRQRAIADEAVGRMAKAEARVEVFQGLLREWQEGLERLKPALLNAALHGETGTDADRAWWANLRARTDALAPGGGK